MLSLFSIAKFVPNLGILLLCLVLILAPIIITKLTGNIIFMFVVYMYYFALGFSCRGFIINFCINLL